MKRCPYCAEEIQDSASKCRYCGEWLISKAEKQKSPANNEKPPDPRLEKAPEKAKTQEKDGL